MNAGESNSSAAGSGPMPENAGGHGGAAPSREARQVSRGSLLTGVVVLAVVTVAVAIFGIVNRKHAGAQLTHYTDATAAPPVSLAQPVFEKNATEIVLPGNIQAYTLAPIYARTTGYVKAWYHDIGSRGRKGEMLAVIETPELDQQPAQHRRAQRCNPT